LKQAHPNEPDVVTRGRVKGYLQPARGIGDGVYKRPIYNQVLNKRKSPWNPPYTTAEPEVKIQKLTPSDQFIVLATDGLWDFFSNEEVVQFVSSYLKEGGNASTRMIAEVLGTALIKRKQESTPEALQQLVSLPGTLRRKIYDDTTVVIVKLNV